MRLFETIETEGLTPSRLWSALDEPTRTLAAKAMYGGERELAREADTAIATALRFRELAVRQMPRDKRAGYLAGGRVPADDTLASSMLMALHLQHRVALLGAFLDALGIPHEDGLIDPDYDLDDTDGSKHGAAIDALYERFPAAEVELYVACLIAMDPDAWQPLAAHVRRADAPG